MTEREMLTHVVVVLTIPCVNGWTGPHFCPDRPCQRCGSGRTLRSWAATYGHLLTAGAMMLDPSEVR